MSVVTTRQQGEFAMILSILETLGFKEGEVNAYLALLDVGPVSGGELAKKMRMPRPTIYGYLDKLVVGGLVTQSLRRGVKIYVPESVDKIRQLYNRKISDLKAKEKTLDTLIPELEKRLGSSFIRPRIQMFEGRHGMEEAFQDNLNYSNIKMLAFWPIKSAIETTSKEFFWYLNKQRIKQNLYLKGIWPPEQAVDIKQNPFMGVGEEFKREIRIAPNGIDSTMGYWVYANKVLFASSIKESFCFIIESAELFEMMANQHKILWNASTPINPKAEDMKPFLDDLKNND